uniref:Uncharacterized protein n=1 Tax=Bos indicus x Bos taurus TaxID=30522 RepID=A0A4W2FRR7_BOBOX
VNRSLAVLTNPKSSLQPTQNSSTFFGSLFCKVQKLLAPLPPFPTDHPVWFIVCVDVIALGGKGLASIDAKKKSFLLTAHTVSFRISSIIHKP